MPIEFNDINDGLRRITISGRLDIPGTDEIELKFTAYSACENRRVLVDLTQVIFLASIGIRTLISNAKSLQQRGGKMILFVGDNAAVSNALETTGIHALIPVFTDESAAIHATLG